MFCGIAHESFATYASALNKLNPHLKESSLIGDDDDDDDDASATNPLLLTGDQDDDTKTTTTTTATTTTTRAVLSKPLALNSHMDVITVMGLLRLPPHPYNHLTLYRVELDYNNSHEIIDQLHHCHTVEFDYCHGIYVHKVIAHCLSPLNNNSYSAVSTLHFCCDEDELSEQVIDAFCHGLPLSRLLSELRLTVDLPTADVVAPFINAINQCESLQTLDLSRCEFGADDAIATLCDGLSKNMTLRSLSLSHCRLEDDEVAQVATALQDHPTLLDLNFRMNYAQDEAIDAISEYLIRRTPRLQSLDLAQQNPGILNLKVLAMALAVNTTLQKLYLQENFLRDAHVDALVTAMTQNYTLRELNMENCELRTVGFSKLLGGLGQFRGIAKLWLKENKFSCCNDAAAAVVVVCDDDDDDDDDDDEHNNDVGRNLTLRVLDVDDDVILPSHVRQVVEWNQGGRQSLSPNAVPLSLWPTILARVDRVFPTNEQKTQPCGKEEGNQATKESITGAAAAAATSTAAADILYYMLHGPALFDR
jgi:hypothetical protein